MNRGFFIVLAIIILFYVTHVVRRNKLPIKESFWWFVGAVAILVLALFPQILDWTASLLGIAYPPTLLLTMCVIFLLFINFKDDRRLAQLQMQNIELEQQVTLIKNKIQESDTVSKHAKTEK